MAKVYSAQLGVSLYLQMISPFDEREKSVPEGQSAHATEVHEFPSALSFSPCEHVTAGGAVVMHDFRSVLSVSPWGHETTGGTDWVHTLSAPIVNPGGQAGETT